MEKRIFLLFLLSSLFSSVTFAQKYSVKGNVLNAASQEAVEFASVGVLRTDSTVAGSAMTDEKGYFKMNLRAPGQYILKLSFMGYQTRFENFKITSQQPHLNMDTLHLKENEQLLGEAVVQTTLARVEQKKDTTVFNAGAYRVPEGSSLEALVKLLPGVEVGEDGSVTWNGKKVKEFLVNGKDFFKGDKDVAMKNLPTDLVSKIKAYDKKSDYTEQTGIDDGEEKTVMDITTKTKLDESWIANADVAYGTKDRYSTEIFATRFTERSHLSAYASIGNANNYRYGGWGGGLTAYKNGGVDFSWKNDKNKREAGKFEVGGSVYYGWSETDQVSSGSSETFLSSNAKSSFSNNLNKSSNSSSYIGANFRMEWAIDSMTTLRFRPTYSHNMGDNRSQSRTATFNDDPYAIPGMANPLDSIFSPVVNSNLAGMAVNRNAHQSLGDSKSDALSGDLNLLRRLNSKGRNVSLRLNGSYRKSESNSFSLSNIYYFNGRDGSFLNQYSNTPSSSWDYNVRLGYAEPITDKLVAEVRYAYGYRFNDSDRSRYNLDRLGGSWADAEHYPFIGSLPSTADSLAAVRDLQNSQYATYKYYDHDMDFNLQYKSGKARLNLGVRLNPEKTKMEYERPGQKIDTVITRDVFQIVPDARFRYRFSDVKSLDIRYRGYSSQPSMTNLLAVVDNSNPLSVSMGNPGLKPSWTNSFSADYSGYETKQQRGVYTGVSYSQTGRSVSNLLVYDETTGVRYMRPQNINGNWNGSGYFAFNTGIGKEKNFTVSSNTSLNYSNAVGFVSSFASSEAGKTARATTMDEHDLSYYNSIFDRADIQKNTTRTTNVYEKLGMNYRKDWLDVGLNSSLNYNHSHSTAQDRSNMDTWKYNYGAHANLTFDFGLSLSTDIGMHSRRGYSDASMNTNELLWNAQISHSFLKDKAAVISLKFYDILHEQSNVSRSVNAMQRNDTWTNGIHSYCMLHFLYKLNIIPGSKGNQKGGKSSKVRGGYRMMHSM